jgi:hypothetical protein
MLAVVYGLAVDNAVPPDGAANHATVAPVGGVAVNINVPVPHLDTSLAVGKAGVAVIVAVTGVLVADTQPVAVILEAT